MRTSEYSCGDRGIDVNFVVWPAECLRFGHQQDLIVEQDLVVGTPTQIVIPVNKTKSYHRSLTDLDGCQIINPVNEIDEINYTVTPQEFSPVITPATAQPKDSTHELAEEYPSSVVASQCTVIHFDPSSSREQVVPTNIADDDDVYVIGDLSVNSNENDNDDTTVEWRVAALTVSILAVMFGFIFCSIPAIIYASKRPPHGTKKIYQSSLVLGITAILINVILASLLLLHFVWHII